MACLRAIAQLVPERLDCAVSHTAQVPAATLAAACCQRTATISHRLPFHQAAQISIPRARIDLQARSVLLESCLHQARDLQDPVRPVCLRRLMSQWVIYLINNSRS